MFGLSTTVRVIPGTRRDASSPTRVFPAPGGSTTQHRVWSWAHAASSASIASRWCRRNGEIDAGSEGMEGA